MLKVGRQAIQVFQDTAEKKAIAVIADLVVIQASADLVGTAEYQALVEVGIQVIQVTVDLVVNQLVVIQVLAEKVDSVENQAIQELVVLVATVVSQDSVAKVVNQDSVVIADLAE